MLVEIAGDCVCSGVGGGEAEWFLSSVAEGEALSGYVDSSGGLGIGCVIVCWTWCVG